MKIVIRGKLTHLNKYITEERKHRMLGAKIKAAETSNVAWQVRQQLKPYVDRLPITTPHKFHFFWFHDRDRIDPDNRSFAQKFILDGMVDAGLLANDTAKVVSGLYHDEIVHPNVKEDFVVVSLYPAQDFKITETVLHDIDMSIAGVETTTTLQTEHVFEQGTANLRFGTDGYKFWLDGLAVDGLKRVIPDETFFQIGEAWVDVVEARDRLEKRMAEDKENWSLWQRSGENPRVFAQLKKQAEEQKKADDTRPDSNTAGS